MAKLTAITFTYQAENWVQHTLASIFNVVDEIIIVDSGWEGNSTDKTFEKIREFNKICKVFEFEHDNFDWPEEVINTKAKIILLKTKFKPCPKAHDHQHIFTELGFKGGKSKYTDWEAGDIARSGNLAMDLAIDRGADWIFRVDDDWVFYPSVIHLRDIVDGNCPKPQANAINIHLVGCYGDVNHIDNIGKIPDIDSRLKDYQFCLPGLFRVSEGFYFCSVAVFPYTRNSNLDYRTYVDRRIAAMHTKFAFPSWCDTEEKKLNNLFKHCWRTAQSLWKDPVVANYNDIDTIEELKNKIWLEVKSFYRQCKEIIDKDFTLDKADRRLILPYPPKVLEMDPLEYVKLGYPYGLPIEYIENAEINSYW